MKKEVKKRFIAIRVLDGNENQAQYQKIDVSEEEYFNYYRSIWAEQKRHQRDEECFITKEKLWMCDGCCVGCPFYRSRAVSLSEKVSNESDLTYEDVTPAPTEDDEVNENLIILKALMDLLKEKYPEGIEIVNAVMSSGSLRDASAVLNMAWSTFQYKFEKIKKLAKKIK